MKTILNIEVPIKSFRWDTSKRHLTTEASDLPRNWLQRVWPDACDLGLQVKGKRETKLFTLAKEERRDGEIVAWQLKEYKPRSRSLWTMTVFND